MTHPLGSQRPTAVRIDLSDDERMAPLLRSGVIWRSPFFWQDAVTAIERGVVPLAECRDVPAEVLELLARDREDLP
jgi:hypothetical protein